MPPQECPTTTGMLQFQGFDEAVQVPGHGREVVSLVGLVALAMSALVHRHHREVRGEDGRHQIPDVARRGEPVKKDDVLATTAPVPVAEPKAADHNAPV